MACSVRMWGHVMGGPGRGEGPGPWDSAAVVATSPAFEKGRDFSKTLGEETEAANEDLSVGMMRAGGVDGLEHRDTSCGPVSGEALRG